MNRSREGTNGLLDALIGRRQLELGVEPFEVMTELLSKRQGMIDCGNGRFRHGDEKDDTGSTVVVTTDKQDAEKVCQLRSRIVQTLNVPQRVRLRAFTRCGLAGQNF